MEIQLQELIERIKSNGVAVAEQESEAKLDAAKLEAEKIIADAKAEAERILADAREENERMVKSSEDAIRQAGRNVLITFRDSVNKAMKAIVGEEIAANYDTKVMAELIPAVVEAWAKKPEAEDISVLLNTENLKRVETELTAALKKRMLSGVTLKADDRIDGGFRIAVQDGAAYYDFSAEAVAELFSTYLSPRVAALLKEASRA